MNIHATTAHRNNGVSPFLFKARLCERTSERFIVTRQLHGSNRSLLVADRLRDLWVVKAQPKEKNNNSLAHELIGHRLCAAVGIPIPDFKVIDVMQEEIPTQSDYVECPLNSVQGCLGPGEYFASRYLPNVFSSTMLEKTP